MTNLFQESRLSRSPVEQAIRRHVEAIDAAYARRPDLAGFELAFDRGNIDADEVERATREQKDCDERIAQEMKSISTLAATEPAAFRTVLATWRASLERLRKQLETDPAFATVFAARNMPSTLDAAIEGLRRWEEGIDQHDHRPWVLWVTRSFERQFGALS